MCEPCSPASALVGRIALRSFSGDQCLVPRVNTSAAQRHALSVAAFSMQLECTLTERRLPRSNTFLFYKLLKYRREFAGDTSCRVGLLWTRYINSLNELIQPTIPPASQSKNQQAYTCCPTLVSMKETQGLRSSSWVTDVDARFAVINSCFEVEPAKTWFPDDGPQLTIDDHYDDRVQGHLDATRGDL